jgi:glyoxylase-like metal-dependent hydrolase (beta-lactamase superfamily II)
MKLTDHCHGVLGFATVPPWTVNAGIIAGGGRTLVVDTGPNFSTAQTLFGYASAVRPGNALVAVNTEPHLDHIGGNAFFREKGIDVYGHPGNPRTDEDLHREAEEYNACIPNRVRRDLREGEIAFEKTVIVNPNIPVRGDFDMDLGGITAKIIMTPGHTPANVSVFVPDDGVLFCGDCIVKRYTPNLECGTRADWAVWSASLDLIVSLKPKIVLPGHGQVLVGTDIGDEIRRVRSVLREAVRSGEAPTA